MKRISPGMKFRHPDGKDGVVLHQVQMLVKPGRPLKLVDNYRVDIPGSPIEYASSKQILEWVKNRK